MNARLRQVVRDFYDKERLSAGQLRVLRQSLARDEPVPSKPRWLVLLLAVCASIAIVVAGSWIWTSMQNRRERVAEEIALNHLARKPLDVRGNAISALRPAFVELGFALTDSSRPEARTGMLEGGRYCSVQGVRAAQLRYSRDNDAVTVYQAPYRPKDHGAIPDVSRGEEPAILHARGVRVTLWVENGLLFGVASSGATSSPR